MGGGSRNFPKKDEAVEMATVFDSRVSAATVNGEICGGEEQLEGDVAGQNQGHSRQRDWQLWDTSVRR